MPHLDEGALWVRATMPYTISFDESAKIVPQIRAIIASFPEVTTVASEHGRPDDGTDATGFFNAEFYVGLKPYSQWRGSIRTKPQLIAAINDKLQILPGHHLQLHPAGRGRGRRGRDGPQERARGEGLRPRPQHARAEGQGDQGGARACPRHPRRDAGPGARPAEPRRSRSIAPRSPATGSTSTTSTASIQTAIGGDVATQVVQQEKEFDLVVRLAGAISQRPRRDRQHPRRDARRPAHPAEGARRHLGQQRRLVHLPREQQPLHRRPILGRGPRPCRRGARMRWRRSRSKVQLPQGYRADWGGEYSEYTASRAQLMAIVPLTLLLIFLLLFFLYRNFKFPAIALAGVLMSAPVGGILALWLTGNALLGLVRDRLPRPVRRLGADRARLHLLRQRAAPRPERRSAKRSAKPRSCGCGRS